MYTTDDQVGRTLNYQVKVAAAILSSRLNELIFTVYVSHAENRPGVICITDYINLVEQL